MAKSKKTTKKKEPEVIKQEDIQVKTEKVLPEEDAPSTPVVIESDDVQQEKLPAVPVKDEDVKKKDEVKFSEGKVMPAEKEQVPGEGRHGDLINPEFIRGRRSEYPR